MTETMSRLLDMLGTPEPDQVQAVEQKANEALKKKYTSTGSYIQMFPLVDDDKIHIMDIYTKLCLDELVDTRGKIQHNKINLYEEIFFFKTREGYPIKRIIVSGSAGIGKTTLIDKIAYDWAIGNSETLNKFKLVFAFKMHSLKKSSNLTEAIFKMLLDKDTLDQSALKEFVDKNQDKVLILLDGFDEFKFYPLDTSSFGSILNILNRKLGTECWVVITSRPPLDKLVNSSLVEKPYAHVRVEGFSDTDKEEYVNKFFPDAHVKASKLTEQIKQSDTLSDLAKSPMLLLLMCLLMGSTKNTLPDTMTRLYNKALNYIFKRKTRDIKDAAISKILISIGKVALGSLLSKDQSFAFREGDFEKSVLDKALNAGVLTGERVIDGVETYQRVTFIHHTFLEYCAVMYWQSLINTEEFDRILDQIELTASSSVSRYDYLLRFCCGDNVACTNHILQRVHQGRNLELVVICYFESQSQELPPANVISSILTDRLILHSWNNDSTNAFFHFLNQVAAISRGNDYLTKAKCLVVSYLNFPRFGEDLVKSIKLMTNLQTLSLPSSSLTADNTNQILSSLASPSTLTELKLSDSIALGGSVSLLAPQLMKLTRLKYLCLDGCSLKAQDVSPIAKSMGDTLVNLDVSWNRALGGCASIWVPELGKMECLQDIDLQGCSVQGTDIEPIAVALSGVSTLVELDLSWNQDLGGCAKMWAQHLKGMRHLEEVKLRGCKLINKDVEPIAVALSGVSTLAHLNLRGNNALGGCASLWAQHLKKMNHLKRLTLMNCNLTGGDMEPIAESVSDMPNLNHLDLSRNDPLIGCASFWAPHLKLMTKHLKRWNNDSTNAFFHFLNQVAAISGGNDYFTKANSLDVSCFNFQRFGEDLAKSIKLMTNLQSLSLKDSSLTAATTNQILSSLASPSTLTKLHLSSNKALGGSVSSLVSQLMKLKCLKKLHLPDCSLEAQDVSPIAESMGDTLVHLSILLNRALGGYASIWGPELGKMECLQGIYLGYCSLQGTDIEPIAVALSGVSTLVKLDLSWNPGLGGCAKMWAQHLKGMRHLEEVKLCRCKLGDKDIEPIAVALSGVQTLAHLILMDNDALGGCASLWAQHLKKMNHLKRLRLIDCNLTGGDIEPIAESVSDMPNLIYLDLSDNDQLDGCASFWAPHLKLMIRHLTSLMMGYFTDEDKQHINASIGLNSPILTWG
ncbi:NLR family CARD domain-containing protein 4-like [Asterias rubens]|uniref:NLR family CARD domain-containing protein 4-like n=1 Tax=Asterias rubens TaxID=7604 RepID=UPI001455B365|nr:NLR family CARD domain-containing protein 4-like [Asterias rubens]